MVIVLHYVVCVLLYCHFHQIFYIILPLEGLLSCRFSQVSPVVLGKKGFLYFVVAGRVKVGVGRLLFVRVCFS